MGLLSTMAQDEVEFGKRRYATPNGSGAGFHGLKAMAPGIAAS